jgi:acetyl-CoA acetyltransferase
MRPSTLPLRAQRPVYVVGIGLHPYQFANDDPYVALGLTAVRQALADSAGAMSWPEVETAYVGSGTIGLAAGRFMLRYLGSTGLAVQQVENASATGSSAFRLACLDVASGASDVALALGVDKYGPHVRRAVEHDGIERFTKASYLPVVRYALLAEQYMRETGATLAQLAQVAVKNHGNAFLNPFAQFRKRRTLEQVLASPRVAGVLTKMQCCPRGDGAAAVVVASEAAIVRLGLDRRRAIRVVASVAVSEMPASGDGIAASQLTRRMGKAALEESGIDPRDLDIVELHDAFSIEELVYIEALGLCGDGEGAAYIDSGRGSIGGPGCAVNPSGGLIGMGHPLGPTGVGQIAEIVRQLRGEAGKRQHVSARTGLAHMIGLGQVGLVHVLQR